MGVASTYAQATQAVDVVDQLLAYAVAIKASDIHLEPTKDALHVRMRVDGLLRDFPSLPDWARQMVIARLKILAHIDIAEHRIPQDGSMVLFSPSGDVDLRVSTFPTLYGQKMVIRILNRSYHFLTIDQLGLDAAHMAQIKQLIDRPQGLFLVTGPTGSGKTTTLYALLDYLNTIERNIVTLEDPVEYRIDGITQGHILDRVGFGFAQGIRAVLRQDPDIIMVGEIRDEQTAKTAIQAALTGHLVLSTLHTNDAPSAVMRLVDMGVEPYLVSAALSGVLSQRLARSLCSCKKTGVVLPTQKAACKRLGIDPLAGCQPVGCAACDQAGFVGRVGIFEWMPVSESLRAVMVHGSSLDVLQRQARADGMLSLIEHAVRMVKQGVISLDELMRVC